MAVLNPSNAHSLIAQSNSNQTSPLKRKKPNDKPDTSPQASNSNSTIVGITKIDVDEGHKYTEVVCVSKAHTGKFYKLEGNKGYELIPLKNLRPQLA